MVKRKRILSLVLMLAMVLVSLLPVFALEENAADNVAPVAENLEITTYRNVSVKGRLMAVDPEGEDLCFEISTPPRKGEIELSADGSFVYTPLEGKRGKDYFGYRATDASGNISQEATVIIKIEKQSTKITYNDLSGNGMEYAALVLSEQGIFQGPLMGGNYVFQPSETVSRGEFLSMCMKLAGDDLLTGVTRTGFADDESIPTWVKPYVSTALISGYVTGYGGDPSGPVFDSEAPISISEAAVMLNSVLGVTNVSVSFEDEAVPTWAAQATANLSACRMLPSNVGAMSSSLTRAQAAEMLRAAM